MHHRGPEKERGTLKWMCPEAVFISTDESNGCKVVGMEDSDFAQL